MSVSLSPIFNSQISDINGNIAAGWKIYTYSAGSSSVLATYTDSTGVTPQTNPIIINTLGYPIMGQIWLTNGSTYKLVLTDANDVTQQTVDNVTGVGTSSGGGTSSVSQFQISALSPTYISTTSFSLLGDQTSDFHLNRRLQFLVTAGTVYGTILSSSFGGGITTITMTMDTGQLLDSGLSSVYLSILRADHLAVPYTALPINARPGLSNLKGINNTGSPNTKYDLSVDIATLSNAVGACVTVKSVATLTCDTGLAGPAVNGRDQSSAFSPNSWIYLYFISNGSTLATLASATAPTSFNGSTLPVGYTYWTFATSLRLIGSSIILTGQFCRGSSMYYQSEVGFSSVLSGSTLFDVSIYVPPIASEITLDFTSMSGVSDGSGNLFFYLFLQVVSGSNFATAGYLYIRGSAASTTSSVQGKIVSIPNFSQSFYVSGVAFIGSVTSCIVAPMAYKMPNNAT